MAKKTKLWNVGYIFRNHKPVVVVGLDQLPCWEILRIRSLTARAAARKFIRGNLAHCIASVDLETLNPSSPTFMTHPTKKEISRITKRDMRSVTIEIIK